jgi:hypothetical protein
MVVARQFGRVDADITHFYTLRQHNSVAIYNPFYPMIGIGGTGRLK